MEGTLLHLKDLEDDSAKRQPFLALMMNFNKGVKCYNFVSSHYSCHEINSFTWLFHIEQKGSSQTDSSRILKMLKITIRCKSTELYHMDLNIGDQHVINIQI